uniref:SAM domain-containing protein n=1 Tax=Anisakis simplex TaxID=6269 RepID=A0A0M3JPD9_ANISI
LMESMRELHKQLETIPIRSEDSSANLMAMAAGAPSSSTASPLTPSTAIPTASSQPSTSSRRTTVNRYDESTVVVDGLSNWREVMNKCECDELQLPIIRAIIDKHGLQNTLLRTLQIIIKMKQAFDTAN